MFDKEIIKEKLRPTANSTGLDLDLDEIIEDYEIIDGFYVFRVNNNAEVFQENNYVESWIGYYAPLGVEIHG